jgi:hypothetical protein
MEGMSKNKMEAMLSSVEDSLTDLISDFTPGDDKDNHNKIKRTKEHVHKALLELRGIK